MARVGTQVPRKRSEKLTALRASGGASQVLQSLDFRDSCIIFGISSVSAGCIFLAKNTFCCVIKCIEMPAVDVLNE